METRKDDEQISRAIDAIIDQIEWLSRRSKMLDVNYKAQGNKDVEWIIEASTLMLQLSRTLNELITTRNILDKQVPDENFKKLQNMDNMFMGRK